MFQISPDAAKTLNKLNATYRVSHSAERNTITVEIIDKTTGETYASANGPTEQEATEAAIEVARTAPKPLTPAQKFDEALTGSLAKVTDENRALAEKNADMSRENERLLAELHAAKAGLAGAAAKDEPTPTDETKPAVIGSGRRQK